MFHSIKSKIFISHLFLIILLLGSLSYKHYSEAIDRYIDNVITFYTDSSASIVSTASLAISGENYGNIQLPSFVQEIASNKNILFLDISGKSDYSEKQFSARYTKSNHSMFRVLYPSGYKNKQLEKIERFKLKLTNISSDKVKLNFLIARTQDKLDLYYKSIDNSKNINPIYLELLTQKSPYIDFEKKLLYLSFKTDNKNSGTVSIVFDISDIENLKNNTMKDLIVEVFISLIFSIILLGILSSNIVGPLNKLSKFMLFDFQVIDTNKIPALKSNDEIGILSRRFKHLIQEVQKKQSHTEKKAYIDSLTGVYNRNKLDELFENEIQRVKRYGKHFSIAIIDIDKFKNFNDTYGHLIGDEVLVMLAQCVNNNVRDSDIFARWGGEEFVILFIETSVNEAKIVAEKIKDKIQDLHHQTAGGITASFGITEYIENDTLEGIFKRCDDALYMAKENGRNRVEIL